MRDRKSVVEIRKNNKSFQKEERRDKKIGLLAVFVGCVVGFLNGFLGGGGGMVCVPFFEHFLGIEKKKAHATAIAVIFPLSLISSFVYVFGGVISSNILLMVGIGVLIGGIFGSFLLKFLPTKIIGLIFSILMIVSGAKLIIWAVFCKFYLVFLVAFLAEWGWVEEHFWFPCLLYFWILINRWRKG